MATADSAGGSFAFHYAEKYFAAMDENRRLRAALELDGLEGKPLRTAEEWTWQRARITELRREVTRLRECLEAKNDLLAATNLIVGCTAACRPSAGPDPAAMSDERVQAVQVVAQRLATWWANHKGRTRRKAETTT